MIEVVGKAGATKRVSGSVSVVEEVVVLKEGELTGLEVLVGREVDSQPEGSRKDVGPVFFIRTVNRKEELAG